MAARSLISGSGTPAHGRRSVSDRLQEHGAVWVVPAVCALLAWVGAQMWLRFVPPENVAVARILLDPAAAGASGSAREWIATQAALISSDRVARRVLSDLDSNAIADDRERDVVSLLSNLRVAPIGEGGLISIGFRNANPALARQFADGFVTAYEAVSQEIQHNASESAAAALRQRVNRLREEADNARARMQTTEDVNLRAGAMALAETARLARVAADFSWAELANVQPSGDAAMPDMAAAEALPAALPALSSGVPAQLLREEYEISRQALASARARLSELSGWEKSGRPAVFRIDAAAVPALSASYGARFSEWLAMAGALAGLLACLGARRLDPRVRRSGDLVSKLGVPVLGTLVNADRAANAARTPRHGVMIEPSLKPIPAPALP